jgi:hypothetical protein
MLDDGESKEKAEWGEGFYNIQNIASPDKVFWKLMLLQALQVKLFRSSSASQVLDTPIISHSRLKVS